MSSARGFAPCDNIQSTRSHGRLLWTASAADALVRAFLHEVQHWSHQEGDKVRQDQGHDDKLEPDHSRADEEHAEHNSAYLRGPGHHQRALGRRHGWLLGQLSESSEQG